MTDDFELVRSLVHQLRPRDYLTKTNDWIRGSLPRSSFRIGSPASERPGPAVDRTDRAVLQERIRWQAYYESVALYVQQGDYRKAATEAARALHIEHVALDPKPGLSEEAGWQCVNYLHSYAGEICWTKIHDHPNAICQACRDRKYRTEKQRRQSSPNSGDCSTLQS